MGIIVVGKATHGREAGAAVAHLDQERFLILADQDLDEITSRVLHAVGHEFAEEQQRILETPCS